MSPVARWSLLSRSPALARSSHCLSVTPTGRVVLYGGELKPRSPVDADATKAIIHTLNLRDSHGQPVAPASLTWASTAPRASHASPAPRVGAASVMIGDYFYVWGGRGGPDMAPLSASQAGLWRCSLGAESIPSAWQRVVAANEEDAPQPRSYHALARYGNTIYVHAGCPAQGRTAELHAFDLTTKRWAALAPAPDPPRGGTSLAAVHLNGTPVLLRYAGFAGNQLAALDVYDIRSDVWRAVTPAPDAQHGAPGARSVHGFVRFVSARYPRALALAYYGERDASALGHAGAGDFWSDVWMLEAGAGPGEPELAWRRVALPPEGGAAPAPRGWFPSGFWETGEQTKVVLFGGLLASNERSDELWLLEI
ncbi:hypothetical protein BC834DRAFT_895194, partial [Gloeopeniophorella convolvens]